MQFEHFLSRIDDEAIQEILGGPTIRLLNLLDSQLASPSQLRNLMVSMYTATGLMLNKKHRTLLLDCLSQDDARCLAQILRLPANGDPYDQLKNKNITVDSDNEKALLDFFEIPYPVRESIDQRPTHDQIPVKYSLFPHQRQAAQKVNHELNQSPYRVLLHMPTGAGKTRTAMNIIAEHLRQKEPSLVIWLAYSEELCEQAASEFETAWSHLGNREVKLHRFWGSHKLDFSQINDGFFVGGLSKLYQSAMNELENITKLARNCSLVIIDEAHQATAKTYSLLLESLVIQRTTTGLLGLSATPGRTWADIEKDQELSDFFARRKVALEIEGYDNPIDYLVEHHYLAKAEYKTLSYGNGVALSEADKRQLLDHLDIPETILLKLSEDEQRNLHIIVEIERLARTHQRILIFAPSVKTSNLFASVLQARGLTAYSLTGNTPSLERTRILRDYKQDTPYTIILCNYGVLTTGFDAPRTSAAVIARPTRSLVLYSQMVGRALRGLRAGGNTTAEIVTVVDPNLYGFGSAAEAFKNWEDVWE